MTSLPNLPINKPMDQILNLIQNLDYSANQWAETIRDPLLTKIMYLFTYLGRFYPMLILSILLFILLIIKRKKDYIAAFFIAMPGGYGLMSLLKYLAGRERPPNAVFHVNGYSFPSGHAMMSTIFFIFLLTVFSNEFKSTLLKTIFILLMILFPLAISFSRLYFNVHWLSDIIAGIVLGLIWVNLSLSIK